MVLVGGTSDTQMVTRTFQNMMIVSENSVIPRDDTAFDSGDETLKCRNTMRSSTYKLNTYPAYANLISGVATSTRPQTAGAGP